MNEWFESIVKDYTKEQAIEDIKWVETIKKKLYAKLHDDLLCTISSLLHKFLLKKGVRDIFEYWTLLSNSPPKWNRWENQEEWE